MAQILFGNDDKTDCKEDCRYMHKFRALFPLDQPDDQSSNTDLNQFTWKHIYVYDDHLAVFKSPDQLDPPTMISDSPAMPKQTDFLNNYPLASFLLPCKVKLCSVNQFKKLNKEILPDSNFQIDEKVLSVLGPTADTTCIMLIQDLLSPTSYFYVCSENAKMFWQFKLSVEELILLLPFEEQTAQMQHVNSDYTELESIFFHMDQNTVVATNNNKNIATGPSEPGYKEFYKSTLGTDFFDPAATNMGKNKLKLKWLGDEGKKPDVKRCFQINIKEVQDTGLVDMGHEIMCIIEDAMGQNPMTVSEASQIAEQWTEKINNQNSLIILQNSREFMKSCVDETCMKTITPENKMTGPIYINIHLKALMIDEICNGAAVKAQVMDIEECEKAKQIIIVNQIEELCERNKACMQMIANDIEEGKLPLTEEGSKVSWDPLNPYRELDSANKEMPPPVMPEPIEDDSNLSDAQKEIQKIQKEIGVPLDIPPVQATSTVRPSLIEIQKSVGTLNGVLMGKNVDDLAKLSAICTPSADNSKLARSIALIPFISRFDPWLEYCGYIRDIQSKA